MSKIFYRTLSVLVFLPTIVLFIPYWIITGKDLVQITANKIKKHL